MLSLQMDRMDRFKPYRYIVYHESSITYDFCPYSFAFQTFQSRQELMIYDSESNYCSDIIQILVTINLWFNVSHIVDLLHSLCIFV